MRVLFLSVIIFLSAFLTGFDTVPDEGRRLTGSARITDGDTFVLNDEKIRLHGIDAPENRALCIVNGVKWACADAATHLLRQLTEGNQVACNEQDVDRYGRVVAKCYLERVDISELLALTGWVMAMPKYSDDYVEAEEMAREAGRGLWRSN